MPSFPPWFLPAAVAIIATLYGILRLFILYRASAEARKSCNWMLGACARPSFTGQAQLVTAIVFLIAIFAFMRLWAVLP
jgi:hypothetical protein